MAECAALFRPTTPRRLSPAGGAAITDIDLSQPLAAVDKPAIDAAFLAHHVVIFPGQKLSREQQFLFAANFGEVETHGAHRGETKRQDIAHVLSNLDADGNPTVRFSRAGNHNWHTDKPYYPAPPLLTMLHAVELPPTGGDTEFADMTMAYDALPETTKQRIAVLRVAFGPAFEPERGTTATHPLVRTHPDTGRKSLYIGNHSTHVVGLAKAEGTALLAELLAHATQRRFVYTHRWRLGDLVMWDNRCLLHRVVPDDSMRRHRRILYRSVVKGSIPI
ncbi:MAG TPA: TauD/TfdA family dioxygenase [Stellaceae bacterium]|jgi:alpha-ketoglutarate-dependent taurine dioxygenase|nr:TauD/TfdA family dioxygenase [Stellaceae bacterium]